VTRVAYRSATTNDLGSAVFAQLLDLFSSAWPDGDFSADDVDHALGGRHLLAEADGRVVAHASVVERVLDVDGRPLRTGYVEAVATLPAWRGRGIASRLMEEADSHIRASFELGALSTDVPGFYARLGWRLWQGELWVRAADGDVESDRDEEGIMVLTTPATPPLTLREALGCAWRPGDCW
jgi:aminoglycoside 2'-N-acetyltransferase I